MGKSDYTEYILRFSFGKDSFKTLDVIFSRGLPLDRITTTDVWATETIPAWLPPMDEFKTRAEDWIWTKYRMEVEHLCATNKDGSKRTYEQMFYHIPNRRSQTVKVERDGRRPAPGVPGAGNNYRVPTQRKADWKLVSKAQNCPRITSRDFLYPTGNLLGARNSKSIMSEPLSQRAPHEAQEKKYRGISGHRSG